MCGGRYNYVYIHYIKIILVSQVQRKIETPLLAKTYLLYITGCIFHSNYTTFLQFSSHGQWFGNAALHIKETSFERSFAIKTNAITLSNVKVTLEGSVIFKEIDQLRGLFVDHKI